jgi:uncharacterized membrane protein
MNVQPVQKSRLAFIDLLRGWALLVMIEVHVFNAFIFPELKLTSWYHSLNFVNGLVAPSFTFISGFVFLLASRKKLDSFRTYRNDFWRQTGRITLIWLTGYALHLPFYSFRKSMYDSTREQLLSFYQSDVLHCIAFGLLILFLLRLLIKKDRIYSMVLLSTGLFVVLTTPLIWMYDFTQWVPAPVAAYMNSRHYSLFPLFPWLAFMLFGGYLASAYITAREEQREKKFIVRIAAAGIVIAAVCAAEREFIDWIPFGVLDVRANPFFFFERMGIVTALLALCWFYADYRKTQKSTVLDVSRESLMVYAAHLMVIYGRFWEDKSLAFRYGGTWRIPECTAGTVVLMLIMIAAAGAWGWLKRRHGPLAKIFFWIFTGTLTIMFLTK